MPLDQLTEFWQVWDCLRDCGWTQVRVGGDPRFVRPGCASGYGQEGFEWFGDDEAVQDHVRDHCIDGRERTGALEWWELWDALRDQGWTRHHDWKLLAPGGSVDGREGLHWFATPGDVVAFRSAPPRRQDVAGRPGDPGAAELEEPSRCRALVRDKLLGLVVVLYRWYACKFTEPAST